MRVEQHCDSKFGLATCVPSSAVAFALALFFCVSGAVCFAQTPAASDTKLALNEQIDQLILDLGSDSFATREEATNRLLNLGVSALGRLKRVTTDNIERYERARRILVRVEQEQFTQLSRSFLLDADPTKSYGLPAWERYSKTAGSSRTSKLLFLEMIKSQPELSRFLATIDGNAGTPQQQALLRQTLSVEANRLNMLRLRLSEPEIGNLVALLFSSTFFDGNASIEVNTVLSNNALVMPISSYMRRRGYEVAMRRLLAGWIPKTHDGMASRAMDIALEYRIETGVEIARKNLNANLDVRTRGKAIATIARFGNEADIPLLVELLAETTTYDRYKFAEVPPRLRESIEESEERPPGALPTLEERERQLRMQWIVRINDLAFAAAIMLSEEDPELTIPGFEWNTRYGFDRTSIAIADSPEAKESRSEQILKWKKEFESKRENKIQHDKQG